MRRTTIKAPAMRSESSVLWSNCGKSSAIGAHTCKRGTGSQIRVPQLFPHSPSIRLPALKTECFLEQRAAKGFDLQRSPGMQGLARKSRSEILETVRGTVMYCPNVDSHGNGCYDSQSNIMRQLRTK